MWACRKALGKAWCCSVTQSNTAAKTVTCGSNLVTEDEESKDEEPS